MSPVDRVQRPWAPPPMDGYRPMVINVALTGAVPGKQDNASVPITPEEIAAEAIACARGRRVSCARSRARRGRPEHASAGSLRAGHRPDPRPGSRLDRVCHDEQPGRSRPRQPDDRARARTAAPSRHGKPHTRILQLPAGGFQQPTRPDQSAPGENAGAGHPPGAGGVRAGHGEHAPGAARRAA